MRLDKKEIAHHRYQCRRKRRPLRKAAGSSPSSSLGSQRNRNHRQKYRHRRREPMGGARGRGPSGLLLSRPSHRHRSYRRENPRPRRRRKANHPYVIESQQRGSPGRFPGSPRKGLAHLPLALVDEREQSSPGGPPSCVSQKGRKGSGQESEFDWLEFVKFKPFRFRRAPRALAVAEALPYPN